MNRVHCCKYSLIQLQVHSSGVTNLFLIIIPLGWNFNVQSPTVRPIPILIDNAAVDHITIPLQFGKHTPFEANIPR